MNNNIFYELKEKEFNADEQYRVVISGYEEGNDGCYVSDNVIDEKHFNFISPILRDIYINYYIGEKDIKELYAKHSDCELDKYLKELGYNDKERHILIEDCELDTILPYFLQNFLGEVNVEHLIEMRIEKTEPNGKTYEIIFK